MTSAAEIFTSGQSRSASGGPDATSEVSRFTAEFSGIGEPTVFKAVGGPLSPRVRSLTPGALSAADQFGPVEPVEPRQPRHLAVR